MIITTAYFDRSEKTIEGFFTLRTIERDDSDPSKLKIIKEFVKLPARSGQKGAEKTSWERTRSPIPWTRNANVEAVKKNPSQFPECLWLWLRKVLQVGEWAGDKGIGEFRYISSGLTDPTTIQSPSNPSLIRKVIGIHPENNYPGSLGCLVLLVNTEEQRKKVLELQSYVKNLAKTTKLIRLEVI